jgi:primosomal protein N' (replication factor Y)
MNPPIVRVALDVPLPQSFDYIAADASAEDIGRRACVPFGRGEKIGIVLEVRSESDLPPEKLKPVRAILRDAPPFPADWLALAEFCSRYYQHPLGEVIALALPPALRRRNALPRLPDQRLFRITEDGRLALKDLKPRSIAARALAAAEVAGALSFAELRGVSADAPRRLPEWLAQGWLAASSRRPDWMPPPDPSCSTSSVARSMKRRAPSAASPPFYCTASPAAARPRSICA